MKYCESQNLVKNNSHGKTLQKLFLEIRKMNKFWSIGLHNKYEWGIAGSLKIKTCALVNMKIKIHLSIIPFSTLAKNI